MHQMHRSLRSRVCRSLAIYGFLIALGAVCQAPVPNVDRRALDLLAKSEKTLKSAKTLAGETTAENYMADGRLVQRAVHKHWIRRPNVYRVETYRAQMTRRDTPEGPKVVLGDLSLGWSEASDGNTLTSGVPDSYSRRPAKARPRPAGSPLLAPFLVPAENLMHDAEWGPARLDEPGFISLRYVGQERWRDTTYEVVEWVYRNRFVAPEDDFIDSARLYVNPQNVLARIRSKNTKGAVTDEFITALALDASISDADVTLPGSTADSTSPQQKPSPPRPGPQPLTVGATAPEFSVPTVAGDTFRLAEVTRTHDATVVFVWFYG